MGLHNVLRAGLVCPRCGTRTENDIQALFGYGGEQVRLAIGDLYPWDARAKVVSHGARPPDGNTLGVGWTLCPVCEMDYFVLVEVRADRIVGVRPDPEQHPQGPDGMLYEPLECPKHGLYEQEIWLYAGVGSGDRKYRVGEPYVIGGNPSANATLRFKAVCDYENIKVHEFFVFVDVRDGRIAGVRVDPDQKRFSDWYRRSV